MSPQLAAKRGVNLKASASQSQIADFSFRLFPQHLLFLLLFLFPVATYGQLKDPAPPPPPISPAEGEKLARELVANLLAQKPSQSSTTTAVMTLYDPEGKRRKLPVTFAIVSTPTNYWNIYETTASKTGTGGMRLTIIHTDNQPNEYLLSEPIGSGRPKVEPKKLSKAQLMMSFAGSDFWMADLGLEFLHWPQQRVLKKEMKRGQSCDVLESIDPHPAPGGYARVLSWIGSNHPDETVLVHADAFDQKGNLLKQFDPKKLQKIQGAYQLESMEMRNAQTDSRTLIEFNLRER